MIISLPWPLAIGNKPPLGHVMLPSAPPDAALGPRAQLYGPRAASGGPSYDIMFGPWAAYFPVSLSLACNIVPIRHYHRVIDL